MRVLPLALLGAVIIVALLAIVPATDTWQDSAPHAQAGVETEVRIEEKDGRLAYYVNGVEKTVQGMGYNVLYVQRGLTPEQREKRLRGDFQLLRSIGVNTLQSWQDPEVDRLHLDLAAEYGLDVLLYYHLPPGDDYADPAVQEWHRWRVREWMLAWRDHPAVVMWGIGNETLLGAGREKAETFFAFYAGLVREAAEIDPRRPIVYREAEDWTAPILRDAFLAVGGWPKQFVFGMNFYNLRLGEVLAAWDEYEFDVPLFISEFAPIGGSPSDRPDGFRRFWDIIRQHGGRVIGGAPYTWTTEGPEATDRLFGLVDDHNRPRDLSLARLSEIWGGTYGRPGDSRVEVPGLVGMSVADARAILFASGLDIQVQEPRSRSQRAAEGISSQSPREGRTVPRGSTVRVVAPLDHLGRTAGQFEEMATRAQELALELAEEAAASLDRRYEETRAGVEAELRALAPSRLLAERAAPLAAWRARLETLAHLEVDGRELFPGAQNIIPVYAGLSRHAVSDTAAFEQAESFARAVLAEWLAAIGR